jgi:hypothetical protein
MGLVDGAYSATLFSGGPEAERTTTRLHKCVAGKSNDQLAAMARKYLSNHPEKWDQPMNVFFFLKIIDCPGLLTPE